MEIEKKKQKLSLTLVITSRCNLSCIYCYQKHDDKNKMSLGVAISIIDKIFCNVPDNTDEIVIKFFGGEPLLEFELIKEIVGYIFSQNRKETIKFYAPTNGTLLNYEMKEWFTARKDYFVLGLSIDGAKETQNYNRCNSFEKIDINFFLTNWPDQGVKVTLSNYSLPRLAENIKFLHSCGFKEVNGGNLAEGNFDWSNENYIKVLVPQLKELIEFYVDNDTIEVTQMFNMHLEYCEAKEKQRKKWCGIGSGNNHYIDGKQYPCDSINPMVFTNNELSEILKTDFSDDNNFIDEYCFYNCYIYPICPNCVITNYFVNKNFKESDKKRCRIKKLIALFIADLQAKRIAKNPKIYDENRLYHTIKAIKKIRSLYLPEFDKYLK